MTPSRRLQAGLSAVARAATGFVLLVLLGWAPNVGGGAQAAGLAAPQDDVVLTVSGKIENTNAPEGARFDRRMLKALPAAVIQTATPWTDGVPRFEGPLLREVLALVGAQGSRLKATALNDYTVVIPVSDVETYPVILAMKMDGKVLRIRDKGPLWVIYPWNDAPELRTEVGYARSIWQLFRLKVVD